MAASEVEWRDVVLEELAASARNALVGGPFGSDLVTSDYSSVGVPVIRGENLSSGRWVGGDFVFVPPAKAQQLAANTAGPLDIVFTQRGANHYRQVAVVRPDTSSRLVISQSQMKLTVDPKRADPLFVYYLFRSPAQQEYLQRNAIQTGVPHTNLSILKRVPLRIPSLPTQRAIAHILGTLDDKIELNRRTNETLEAIARALFKSWFVDFDPVRAKTEGRDAGLPKPVADLFPDRFVDSKLGAIPEGWTCAGLGKWVAALSGGTPSKGDATLWDGDIPWISPKVMTAIHADEAEAYVAERALGNGTRLAPAGATLVMVRGMGLHEKVRISYARQPVAFNQDVKALVPRSIEPSLLLFALLGGQGVLLDRVESSGHGTGRLPSDVLLAHPLAMPNRAVQARLTGYFDVINDRIASARAEVRTLATLRDDLLPKLISGDLRVRDTERTLDGGTA